MTAMPRQFGRYVLTDLIGEGGMAEVYAANLPVAHQLAKRVVVKKIRELGETEAGLHRTTRRPTSAPD